MTIFSSATRYCVTSQIAIGLYLSLVHVGSIHAQVDPDTWGSMMCKASEVDFGSVPRGAITSKQITLKNVFQEDIQITALFHSAGCFAWVEASQLPLTIPSGEERHLTLRANSIQFYGERKGRLSITLFDPVHAVTSVVEFPAKIRIRQDLVVPAGAGSIGIVQEGIGATHQFEIRYSGPLDWRLLKANVANKSLDVAFSETSRAEGIAVYELTVNVKPDAPKGVLYDHVILESNEEDDPKFSIPVEGRVEPEIAATDANFGKMHTGTSKTVNVVVRGLHPIEILGVEFHKRESSTIDEQAIQVKFNRADARPVHVIPITLDAPNKPGTFEEEFRITVAGCSQTLSFKARGLVIEQAGAAKQ